MWKVILKVYALALLERVCFFFLILNDFIILQKCSGSNIWDNM